jgi:hypothetical protein
MFPRIMGELNYAIDINIYYVERNLDKINLYSRSTILFFTS